MIFESKDNINHLSFQLLYKGKSDGLAIKKATENLVDRGFLPALQTLLDKYSPAGSLLTIDKIVCDIHVNEREFNEAVAGKIIAELEKQLIEKGNSPDGGITSVSGEARFVEILFFYLKNGFMPWYANISSRAQLNELLAASIEQGIPEESIRALIQLLRLDAVILRICNDFDEPLIWAFIALLIGSKGKKVLDTWRDDYEVIISAIHTTIGTRVITQSYKKSLLKSIADYGAAGSAQAMTAINLFFAKLFATEFVSEIKSPEIVEQLIAARSTTRLRNEVLAEQLKTVSKPDVPNTVDGDKPRIEMKTNPDEIPKKPSEEPIYVNNSGLVIVAPYLNMFFKRMEVVADNKIINHSKAITLLHYIATAKETFAEFEVVLPKLLCGFEPDFAIPAPYEITPDDIELVDEMLKAVISNWTILKNTSVAGLREAFLLREGKLTFMAEGSRLKVQRNSIDVLLDQIPWNISMIKLPWMTNLLTVDWL